MISCLLYRPAQVSWSDGFSFFSSFFCLAQVSQSDDF